MQDKKPLRVLLLGYGIRGRGYAGFIRENPAEFTLVGVADPVAAIPADIGCPTWKHWKEALECAGRDADAVVAALPDAMHLEACVMSLELGCHVLLEKPMGCSWLECEQICAAQRKAGKFVLIAHVLRFNPLYRELYNVIKSGEIGEIASIHHLAAISYGKASHAYCRGNWRVEEDGSGTLINKCIHDFDLINWWMGPKRCLQASSFGSLMHWRPSQKPQGAAERCSDCPECVRNECPYDANRLYMVRKDLRYHFPDESDAAMRDVIEHSPYGRCVYAGGNNSVDHQTVMLNFEGGTVVTLEVECFTRLRERITHFYGTRGEIKVDNEKITVTPFLGESRTMVPSQQGHHGGGDRETTNSFARIIREGNPELWTALLDEAAESHRMAFMSEISRKTGKTIENP